MTTLEKYHRVMELDASCPTLKWEFGYWGGTLRRWYEEGLPRKNGMPEDIDFGDTVTGPGGYWRDPFRDSDVADVIGYDKREVLLPVEFWIHPRFERKVLEETDEYQLIVDKHGVVSRLTRDHGSKPFFIDWPVKNREDFEKLKVEKFVLSDDRFPSDWNNLLADYEKRDYPLSMMGAPCGFFGSLRWLFGEERLLTIYYDDPELAKDVLTFLTDFWIALADRVLEQVKVDSVQLWEDMCFKNGPLISPALFCEFMLPCYKKLTSFLKGRGVKNIILDTDGDCWKLIPLFLEGGITGLYPMEVQAGMDVREVRKAFPKLQILGGIDKNVIARGPDAIDGELDKVRYMIEFGGYVPTMDHHVPPEVSWRDFVYYRQGLHRIIGD